MIFDGYTHFGGIHGETAGLRNILIQQGVTGPHNGEPLGEAMLLGIGGGLGGGYFHFQFADHSALVLGFRHKSHQSNDFLLQLGRRLGLTIDVQETGSKKTAAATLQSMIERRQAGFAWVDKASLSYWHLPASEKKYFVHAVVVCGAETDGTVLLDDRAVTPWRVPADIFAEARSIMPYNKHRTMTFSVAEPLRPETLEAAILDGIRIGCEEALNPPIRNFGLPALEKWADLLVNRKDKKGWPALFPPGRSLYQALTQVFDWVATTDSDGSALREMYAAFLDEAATVLANPELAAIATEYRTIAEQWRELATAALPDSIAPFKQTRTLLRERQQLFAADSAANAPRLIAIDGELSEIAHAMQSECPLGQAESLALLVELHDRLLAIATAETSAVQRLQAATLQMAV